MARYSILEGISEKDMPLGNVAYVVYYEDIISALDQIPEIRDKLLSLTPDKRLAVLNELISEMSSVYDSLLTGLVQIANAVLK